jgi:hypothetical protein
MEMGILAKVVSYSKDGEVSCFCPRGFSMKGVDLLWRSASNVRRVSNQLDAIVSEVESLLEEPLSFKVELRDREDGNLADGDDEWIYTYYWFRYHVRSRGKSGKLSHLGYVIFAISLWRPEDEQNQGWIGAQSAKLYVGFSPDDYDFSEYFYLDGSGKNAIAKANPPYIWSFGEDRKSSHLPFFFCLPLLNLGSREDLRREVIRPLSDLLESEFLTQDSAFANARYPYKTPRK